MRPATAKRMAETGLDSNGSANSPLIVTKTVIDKLEKAWAMGCSDKEACLYANIGITSLHLYQQHNPDFITRKEILKQNPVLKARQKVVTEISSDVRTAQWYLERKCRDEFSPQHTVIIDELQRIPQSQLEAMYEAAIDKAIAERQLRLADPDVIEAELG